MVTFHPTAARQGDGSYRAMVIIRNPKGQCVGSRVRHSDTFVDKEDARNFARAAAHKVASTLGFARVA